MNKTRPAVTLVGIFSAIFLSCASSKMTTPPPSGPMLTCTAPAPSERPVLLWSTSGFSAPESVAYDRTRKLFYVSNVAGSPVGKDGIGWIAKLGLDGRLIERKWADGMRATTKALASPLNAPKGLGLRNGVLWTADIDEAVAIQTSTGRKTASVKIAGAKFLNDVAFGSAGEVLVSDMLTDRIHSLTKSSSTVLREGAELEGPNGLASAPGVVLVASWGPGIRADFSTALLGRILTLDPVTKKLTPWTTLPLGNLDGLEFDGPDAVFVSDWMAGKVYHVKKNGDCRLILEGFKGAADLTFVPAIRMLVIPLMGEDRVVGYRIP